MIGRFNHSNSFRKAFENNCIKLLISAYQESTMENSVNLNWEENDITDHLHEYVINNPFRLKKHIVTNVESYLANKFLQKDKGFAARRSRIDMRFVVIKSGVEYIYFAEAKLLKEHDNKLKKRYIKTGIDNFISGKYYDGFLVAYIVEGVLINAVKGINKLLEEDHRESEILKKGTCNCHDRYYESFHDSIGILKHFMFDFTNCGNINAA